MTLKGPIGSSLNQFSQRWAAEMMWRRWTTPEGRLHLCSLLFPSTLSCGPIGSALGYLTCVWIFIRAAHTWRCQCICHKRPGGSFQRVSMDPFQPPEGRAAISSRIKAKAANYRRSFICLKCCCSLRSKEKRIRLLADRRQRPHSLKVRDSFREITINGTIWCSLRLPSVQHRLHLFKELKSGGDQLRLTLWVVAVLGGLNRLPDLHSDDVDFRFAVLQHLLGRLQHLLILGQTGTNRNKKTGMKRKWRVLASSSIILWSFYSCCGDGRRGGGGV